MCHVHSTNSRNHFRLYEPAMKRRLAQQAAIEDRLRTRETEAAQLLSAEQGRWVELNSKLDELERLLGPVR
jgi:hypothetical protein